MVPSNHCDSVLVNFQHRRPQVIPASTWLSATAPVITQVIRHPSISTETPNSYRPTLQLTDSTGCIVTYGGLKRHRRTGRPHPFFHREQTCVLRQQRRHLHGLYRLQQRLLHGDLYLRRRITRQHAVARNGFIQHHRVLRQGRYLAGSPESHHGQWLLGYLCRHDPCLSNPHIP